MPTGRQEFTLDTSNFAVALPRYEVFVIVSQWRRKETEKPAKSGLGLRYIAVVQIRQYYKI